MMTKGLYWFTNDLRLDDNKALNSLLEKCQKVIFLYVIDPRWFQPNNFYHKPIGSHRWLFIQQSIIDIEQQLKKQGHTLYILEGKSEDTIIDFIAENNIDIISSAEQVGFYERKTWEKIKSIVNIKCYCELNSTLFTAEQIDLNEPSLASFTTFRKKIESSTLKPSTPVDQFILDNIEALVPVNNDFVNSKMLLSYYKIAYSDTHSIDEQSNEVITTDKLFTGGETAALIHTSDYFSTNAALSYKKTRNSLDGWLQSTKFSPYLAAGNISSRQLWHALKRYEMKWQENESTYWIGFELLWREYFQWLALQQKSSLFTFQGSAQKRPQSSFYSEPFAQWCQGNTPHPLVNACMHQLNATGFMSNRGRQIVASCLVNELSVDWRYGAAYFQQQLIDYDVAANWGNWQYIAGVGADPRGGRHFNLRKQTAIYDPNRVFINKWQGYRETPIDSNDGSDRPCVDDRSDNINTAKKVL
jgi:deoxyribodipyrimidine photo-lyase